MTPRSRFMTDDRLRCEAVVIPETLNQNNPVACHCHTTVAVRALRAYSWSAVYPTAATKTTQRTCYLLPPRQGGFEARNVLVAL